MYYERKSTENLRLVWGFFKTFSGNQLDHILLSSWVPKLFVDLKKCSFNQQRDFANSPLYVLESKLLCDTDMFHYWFNKFQFHMASVTEKLTGAFPFLHKSIVS